MQKKILIIDDSPDIQAFLKILLKKEGYEILKAMDGESGLRIVRYQRPDLILLDIQMPSMSGITVCRILRENPQNDTIYIIMLTASTTKEIESLNTGANDYITKPVKDKDTFLSRIRNGLRQTQVWKDILTDELGLTRFPFFQNNLEIEIYRSKRYNHALSLILFSLDNFDQVQKKGEEIKKKILMQVIELFDLRKSDSTVHQNDGKFILLLPVIPALNAGKTADRLRQKIANYEFEDNVRLTAIFSVVSLDHSENLLSVAGNYLLNIDGNGVIINGQPFKKGGV